ncbi:hypothetical protein CERZMDRAFT_46299 [Cercospora zeae-maydis SCOH1-5]|uniref:Alpha/beta hydrolase fold-3 domain-containing protein n=1 Tax=Cercospora zeae-maydis SCOH1-5 TaxID=717836 RepID=A0A6A6F8V5_9PEZI|nr:hypothetical protein CERZMDRAFT_46299 [Cercospora zeae-maydis SCOH1-5]
MPLLIDPELRPIYEPILASLTKKPQLEIADIPVSRASREAGVVQLYSGLPDAKNIQHIVHHATAIDGYAIPIHGFTQRTPQTSSGPAALHFHGGGMTMGSALTFAKPLAQMASRSGVPIYSVDYRLAPEAHGDTLVEDCYAALLWLRNNANELGIDVARLAVYGESAGGGLAAGVALLARDRKLSPPLAKQILVYPMLEDRGAVEDMHLEPVASFKTRDKQFSWAALLGDQAGDPDAPVSPYAVPARALSLANLPPTYVDVGELDIFRDECLGYTMRLLADHVPTEFHLYPGVPHAFETLAPHITATVKAQGNRIRALQQF